MSIFLNFDTFSLRNKPIVVVVVVVYLLTSQHFWYLCYWSEFFFFFSFNLWNKSFIFHQNGFVQNNKIKSHKFLPHCKSMSKGKYLQLRLKKKIVVLTILRWSRQGNRFRMYLTMRGWCQIHACEFTLFNALVLPKLYFTVLPQS